MAILWHHSAAPRLQAARPRSPALLLAAALLLLLLLALASQAQAQDDDDEETVPTDGTAALNITDWQARINDRSEYDPRLLADEEAATNHQLPTNIKLPDPCTVGTYDSGWFFDSNQVDHVTRLRHGFGTYPKFMNLWFSPNESPRQVYLKSWSWVASHSGNPVTISINEQYLSLHMWSGAPLHGIWDPRREGDPWMKYDSGFLRVIACR